MKMIDDLKLRIATRKISKMQEKISQYTEVFQYIPELLNDNQKCLDLWKPVEDDLWPKVRRFQNFKSRVDSGEVLTWDEVAELRNLNSLVSGFKSIGLTITLCGSQYAMPSIMYREVFNELCAKMVELITEFQNKQSSGKEFMEEIRKINKFSDEFNSKMKVALMDLNEGATNAYKLMDGEYKLSERDINSLIDNIPNSKLDAFETFYNEFTLIKGKVNKMLELIEKAK